MYSAFNCCSTSLLRTFALLGLTACVLGTTSINVRTPPNMHQLIELQFDKKPQSITIGKQILTEGSHSNPCSIGQFCWQLLTDKEFGMFLGIPGSGPATIIFTPSDPKKAPTAITVNEKGSRTPDLPVPSGVGKHEWIEVEPTKWTSLMLLYEEEVENIELDGGIQFYSKDLKRPGKNTVLVPHRTEGFKGRITVILTGYIGNTPEECIVKFADGEPQLVTFQPVEGTRSPTILHISFLAKSSTSHSEL